MYDNEMKLEFLSKSNNEAFARTTFTMVNINALKESLKIENKIGTGIFEENTALKIRLHLLLFLTPTLLQMNPQPAMSIRTSNDILI